MSVEETRALARYLPAETTAAAVLVPIVDRPQGLTVLFTERAHDLAQHGGQVSFPGGRLEPKDADALAAALRETEEEIGLHRQFIEVLGYLSDHLVPSGYRVTPVVGLIAPAFRLTPDPTEVASTFEVPFDYAMDPQHYVARQRRLGDTEVQVFDLPYGGHRIWGATAGMLLELYHLMADQPLS